MNWTGFGDRLLIVATVARVVMAVLFVPVAVLSVRQFWKDRFRMPVYVHVLAIIAAGIGVWLAVILPDKSSAGIHEFVRQAVFAAIMPALVYVTWIVYGGPLATARRDLDRLPASSSEED